MKASFPQDPERALTLSYAPEAGRGALASLLALDDALAQLVRTTREPALGQMRLLWWRESLARLDTAAPPAEPVLQTLAAEALPKVTGEAISRVVDGWDVLIEEARLGEGELARFAEGRGRLLVLAGQALGAGTGDPLAAAGEGWALADLALHLNNADEAEAARRLALPRLQAAARARWSRNGRAIGAMAHLARLDLTVAPEARRQGSPARVGRLLWHRITGR